MLRKFSAILLFCCLMPVSALSGQADPADGLGLKLDEIVVTGTKTRHTLKDVPVDTVVLTSSDIQHTNAQTVMDVLRQIPGIATSIHDDVFGTYTWHASMRGLSINDGYALVLVDGQRMVGAGQSGGMGEYGIGLNQIPLNMVDRIEVVKGPGSALYGSDAMAGVINIITKAPPQRPSGSAGGSYGWYKVRERDRNGTVTEPGDNGDYRNLATAYASFGDSPLKNLHYIMNYDYEFAQDISKDPVDSYRHTASGKLLYEPVDWIETEISTILSHYAKTGYRDEDSWRVNARVKIHPVKSHTLSINGYYYDWDFEHGFPGYPYGYKHGDQAESQVELQYGLPLGMSHHFVAGAEYRSQSLDYIIENQDSIIPVEEDIHTYSIFCQDEYSITGWIVAVPGIRYDHHSTFGGEVNPKFSIMAYLSPVTTLRASVGRAFKSPTIRQLYYQAPYEHGTYFIMSNPDLNSEESWGYSLSVEQQMWSGRIIGSVAFFRNDINDLVQRVDTGEIYQNKPLLTYENVGSAVIQGVELSVRADLFQWVSLQADYTYTDGTDRENHRRLTYVPEHAVGIMLAYDNHDFGFGMSSSMHYTGRQYTNTTNTKTITDHAVVDAKIYKDLCRMFRISFEADNIFGSEKGDRENFRTDRTYMVTMDMKF